MEAETIQINDFHLSVISAFSCSIALFSLLGVLGVLFRSAKSFARLGLFTGRLDDHFRFGPRQHFVLHGDSPRRL